MAARLEPLEPATPPAQAATADAANIEPAVLAAMSPARRAQLEGGTAAASSGGLFDAAARNAVLESTQSYETRPLAELLAGIAMPAGLIPSSSHEATETSMAFCTTTATAGEVAALLGAELERLGFDVKAQPPAGALATRDDSAVHVGIAMPAADPSDDAENDDPASPASNTVEVTLTAL